MTKIKTILFMVVGLMALAGGVVLVRNVQETRRGAYLSKLDLSVWPDSKTNMQVGEKVTATVKMDAKTYRISAIDLRMGFNSSTFEVESIEIQNSFDKKMKNEVVDGRIVIIAGNSNADETKLPTGVFDVAKIVFVAKAAGNLNLTLPEYQVPATQSSASGDNKMEMNFLPASYSVGGGGGASTPPVSENFATADLTINPVVAILKKGESTEVVVRVDAKQTRISGIKLDLVYTSNIIDPSNLVTSSSFDVPAESAVIDKTNKKISVYLVSSKAANSLPTGVIEVMRFKVTAVNSGLVIFRVNDNYLVTGSNPNSDVKTVGLNLGTGRVTIVETALTPVPTDKPSPTDKPTPTEIPPTGDYPVLNFKMAFEGMDVNGGCADGWPVTIIVLGQNGESKTYHNLTLQRDTAIKDRAVYRRSLELKGFNQTSNLAVFIKGPKHLQTKYGVNNQTAFYNMAGGQISVTNDVNSSIWYDFSKYPLLPGDIMAGNSEGQDGLVNGMDFARMKALAITHETWGEGQFRNGDLDGNCQYNSRDITLLKNSLNEKLDILY
ncbi:hypothetical protein A2574_00710 [Candidatus Shapirobacteria bacterium RIFOXYD1_FULL_38_32]|uniref:Uncharacterized protein n=1 Tax=Candidatus Shapirobacteria bacterium RIFOXYB1_FULL_38_38 TaxID=1802151 RepID=A0A1F7SWR5_9BACT|nr:MAG: hypothetical protein A2195_02635 [Candidatus Shapirobacteria bacterium RIFOXYA1_FULL_39_17]OGL57305.1 MAG: hypothetical protein A2574_00710 [Candidatus Shapirobacteria bacterium RIFOXYD1_FULL_38_32]OGL57678.1 MAG: hypothetical protein A2367_00895 [Candidatus Shapirobacteria bacterium RIFOXYB1_FULL_38_38]HCU55683.1 hypothetical protein [Candidatus Shapirobacteria bacterium]